MTSSSGRGVHKHERHRNFMPLPLKVGMMLLHCILPQRDHNFQVCQAFDRPTVSVRAPHLAISLTLLHFYLY